MYSSETRLTKELEVKLSRIEACVLGWMCGFKLKGHHSCWTESSQSDYQER